MSALAAIAGWIAAGGLLGLEVVHRHERSERAEALARVSHELRGPLTAIGLALTVGRRGRQSVGDEVAPAAGLGAVELELQRAAAVLGDLDELAAGGRRVGMAPRRLEAVPLDELLAASARGWAAAAVARGAQLHAPRPAARPAVVLGDPARLAQATGNLIANAVEHGGGVVRVVCRCRGEAVRIEVSDDGPGLPSPVEELVRRPRAGCGRRGRGLAIAAEIAAGHGGRLSAVPSRTGARLVLELPAHRAPPQGP